jgi:hypothetical protein
MRVIVCGGRKFNDFQKMATAMTLIPQNSVIVHGGAKGADHLAYKIATIRGMTTEAHLADWKKHGKAAGPIRNQAMLDTLDPKRDFVLAFPDPESKGTWDMVERARKAGVRVEVYE